MIAQTYSEYRYPRHAWSWKCALLLAVPVLAPLVSAVLLVPELRTLTASTAAVGVVLYPVVFVSGVFLYLHWRLTCSPGSYWLTVGLSLVSAHGAVLSVLQLSGNSFALGPVWLIGSDLAVGLVLLAMLHAAERVSPRIDPAAIGIGFGLLIAAVDIAVSSSAAALPHGPVVHVTAKILLVGIGLLLVATIHRLQTLPHWAGSRLGLAVLILTVHWTLAHSATPPDAFWAVLVLVTGSVLLGGTTLALLRAAIHEDRAAIRHLQDLLAATENGARADRDLLHQIRSAVAGICSATTLINSQRQQRRIPPTQLHLLLELVERETARLQRLTIDRRTPLEDEVDLDEVLGPLAAVQRLQGLSVRWSPCGERVRGSADRITEVVQTLLDNARTHADGSPVEIEVHRCGADVEIVVADAGPGVPPDLQDVIFDRGARRVGSAGEGIGLHVAHQLMDEVGNVLRLDTSRERGAAFVVRLPAAERQDIGA